MEQDFFFYDFYLRNHCGLAAGFLDLILDNVALEGHVDAVQELTDILVPHIGGLLDTGSGHGHSSDVVARDLDLVLHIVGAHVCDAVSQLGRRHP